jgi:hypothetical protein
MITPLGITFKAFRNDSLSYIITLERAIKAPYLLALKELLAAVNVLFDYRSSLILEED